MALQEPDQIAVKRAQQLRAQLDRLEALEAETAQLRAALQETLDIFTLRAEEGLSDWQSIADEMAEPARTALLRQPTPAAGEGGT